MHHTTALIIRTEGWAEADCLVSALTPDFGKIRLRAQGSRKHGAKLQGHLEPGGTSEISFVIGRNGYRLTTARLVSFPAASRASFPKFRAVAGVLAAIEANVLEERERASELFAIATAAIAGIETAERPAAVRCILVWFHVRLLAFLGLLPSPRSPEAAEIKSLLALAAIGPDLVGVSGSEDTFERELAWLSRRLGDAVRAIGPVAGNASTLY